MRAASPRTARRGHQTDGTPTMLDLTDRLYEALFKRGIGSCDALFYEPGQDPDIAGVPCRIIISSKDEGAPGGPLAEFELKTRRTVIEVRRRELRAAGAADPEEKGGFKIVTETHELAGAVFEIDDEPMLLDNARRIWTCWVSQPDGAA